ncbi:MAG: class I SAM-dependent methyltransferase [bacterium]
MLAKARAKIRKLVDFALPLGSSRRLAVKNVLRSFGLRRSYCPICEVEVNFVEEGPWLRDQYFCNKCRSIPRQRLVMATIREMMPDWKEKKILEPSAWGATESVLMGCPGYVRSQFYDDVKFGEYKDGYRSEDLENLTFGDETFDLIITQDVFEHIFDIRKAFKEIHRVLKPGGMHIFTAPMEKGWLKSIQRAKMENGKIVHLSEPSYHGNPIDSKGSLVTYHYGADLPVIIFEATGMFTVIRSVKDQSRGLDGEYLDVLISTKK